MEILILISPCSDALGEIQIRTKSPTENNTLLEKEKQALVTGNKGLS